MPVAYSDPEQTAWRDESIADFYAVATGVADGSLTESDARWLAAVRVEGAINGDRTHFTSVSVSQAWQWAQSQIAAGRTITPESAMKAAVIIATDNTRRLSPSSAPFAEYVRAAWNDYVQPLTAARAVVVAAK